MRISFILPLLLTVGSLGAGAQIQFQEVTTSGINFVHHAGDDWGLRPSSDFGAGAAVSDYDRDGDLDVYLCDSRGEPNHLYRNNGDGTFVEVGVAAGVADTSSYSQMALFLDLDNDGWDDLVVFNNKQPIFNAYPPRVYRNNGDGTFTDRSLGSNLMVDDPIIGGASAGDYDHDGDLDISAAGWNDRATHLFRNDGNFTFTDVTVAAGAKPVGILSGWTIVHADMDNDGWQDILAAVDFSQNYLLRNNQDGTFTDMTSGSGIDHTGNDMGIAIADVDNDLDLDAYITDITGRGSLNCPDEDDDPCNSFNINDGNFVFSDVAVAEGVADTEWGWGAAFFDADLDGDRDLLAVTGFDPFTDPGQPAYFFRNDGTAWVEQAQSAGIQHTGDSRGLVPFDYDRDGDMDVLITDAESPIALYENVTPRGSNHWLVVEAVGQLGNRNGVGARVYVTVGAATQMHEVIVGGSFYAGPPLEAHFGLGTATTVDEVRVEFPSGHVVQRFNVPADQRLVLGPLDEVKNLRVEQIGTTSRIAWDAMDDADVYSVFRGDLGSWTAAACLANELLVTHVDDPDPLAPGSGVFYLVRSETTLGVTGTLGSATTGDERTTTAPWHLPALKRL